VDDFLNLVLIQRSILLRGSNKAIKEKHVSELNVA